MTNNEWKDLLTFQDVACAQADGWEIQRYRDSGDDADGWYSWQGDAWYSVSKFRGRPKQPKMKKVKLLSYVSQNFMYYVRDDAEDNAVSAHWIRQPHLDLEGEVPDEQ